MRNRPWRYFVRAFDSSECVNVNKTGPSVISSLARVGTGKTTDQLRWQRLPSFRNIRMLINRGRGYRNLSYLLLKAKRMAVTNIEFVAVHTVKKAA